MGTKLHSTVAGLRPQAMRLEPVIAAGTNSSDQVRYTTDVAVALVDENARRPSSQRAGRLWQRRLELVEDRRMVAYVECSVGRPRTVDRLLKEVSSTLPP